MIKCGIKSKEGSVSSFQFNKFFICKLFCVYQHNVPPRAQVGRRQLDLNGFHNRVQNEFCCSEDKTWHAKLKGSGPSLPPIQLLFLPYKQLTSTMSLLERR